MNAEEIKRRIVNNVGQNFTTRTGDPFTIEWADEAYDTFQIRLQNGNIRNVGYNSIRTTIDLINNGNLDFNNMRVVDLCHNNIAMPTYVWALLHDNRIVPHDEQMVPRANVSLIANNNSQNWTDKCLDLNGYEKLWILCAIWIYKVIHETTEKNRAINNLIFSRNDIVQIGETYGVNVPQPNYFTQQCAIGATRNEGRNYIIIKGTNAFMLAYDGYENLNNTSLNKNDNFMNNTFFEYEGQWHSLHELKTFINTIYKGIVQDGINKSPSIVVENSKSISYDEKDGVISGIETTSDGLNKNKINKKEDVEEGCSTCIGCLIFLLIIFIIYLIIR